MSGGGAQRAGERGGGWGLIDLLSVSSSEDRRQTEALFIEVNAGTRALRLGVSEEGGGGEGRRGGRSLWQTLQF